MKRNKIVYGILCATMLFSIMGVNASAEEFSKNVCTHYQCESIVDEAMSEYGIIVPDEEEYKNHIWEAVQENGWSSTELKSMFKENFENAAERKALNDARATDATVNTVAEVQTILNEINAERYTYYNLGTGPFAERSDYLDTLQLDKQSFKKQLESEIDNETSGGIIEHLGIEDYNKRYDKASVQSIRESIHQEMNGSLTNENTHDSTVVTAYLNSNVYSVSGNPGTFSYDSFGSYGISNSGSATGITCSLNGTRGKSTVAIIASGYVNLFISVNGQIPFYAG